MILLDTHVLLWLVSGKRRPGPRTTAAINRADAVLASAISYVELDLKSRRRKLVVPPDFPLLVREQGIDKFVASFSELLQGIAERRRHLAIAA